MATIQVGKNEFRRIKNLEYYPAFLLIPEEILEKCGREVRSIPRNPHKIIHNEEAIKAIEDDCFLQVIIDAFAYLTWPFIREDEREMEAFSGYDPAWMIAHAANMWNKELTDNGVIPSYSSIFFSKDSDIEMGYLSRADLNETFCWFVPSVLQKYNFDEIIKVTEEMRCFEDFDERGSRRKREFYRKWYHSRTKHPQVSLEQIESRRRKDLEISGWDSVDHEASFEQDSFSKILVEEFMKGLSERDRKILEYRMQGMTLETIAKKLRYRTHSGVLKRIRQIGKEFEKYTGEDLGFHKEKSN